MLLSAQLEGVRSWDEFLERPIALDVDALVSPVQREALMALVSGVRIGGDMVSLEYEVDEVVGGVARLRLREGQARRIQERELPKVDRPLRFAVVRGNHPPLLADSIGELRELMRHGSIAPGKKHGSGRFKPPRHRRR
jgi:hypothetical protein